MTTVTSPIADSGVPQFTTATMPNMVASGQLVAAAGGAQGNIYSGTGPMQGCISEGYYIPLATDPPNYFDPTAPQCYGPGLALSNSLTPPTTTNAPAITPQSLLQRLPSIIQPAPAVKPPVCDSFSQWVNQNQIWLGVGLVFAAYLVWEGKA
jgi:hypothetical protein